LKEHISTTSRAVSDSIPHHVAIIMDGNGRWATKQKLPRIAGHHAGAENCRPIIQTMSSYGVKYLTLYAFSTENWRRPSIEVQGIFILMGEFITHNTPLLHKEFVKINFIGDFSKLPKELQGKIHAATELTQNNTGLHLIIAVNYGGRAEIINATQRIVQDKIKPRDINEELFNSYLYTDKIPSPDLIIRTGGEMRISNFLLWQSAYSEYYFTSTLWPDFNQDEINKAFKIYKQRCRRFGGLSK